MLNQKRDVRPGHHLHGGRSGLRHGGMGRLRQGRRSRLRHRRGRSHAVREPAQHPARFANSCVRVRVVDENGLETERGATVRLAPRQSPPRARSRPGWWAAAPAYLRPQREYTVHSGAVDDGPYDLEVSRPSASRPPASKAELPRARRCSGTRVRPSVIAGRTIAVYRDGRVILRGSGRPSGRPRPRSAAGSRSSIRRSPTRRARAARSASGAGAAGRVSALHLRPRGRRREASGGGLASRRDPVASTGTVGTIRAARPPPESTSSGWPDGSRADERSAASSSSTRSSASAERAGSREAWIPAFRAPLLPFSTLQGCCTIPGRHPPGRRVGG